MKLGREFKKKVHKYIEENLDKGYSIGSIKKSFIAHGYSPELAEKLVRNYEIKDLIVRTSPLLLLLLLALVAVFYRPNITTLAFTEKQYNYSDNIGLTINSSYNYVWTMQNKGLLKSVSLNGEVKANGSVKAYLRHGNDMLLIFDNKRLEEPTLRQITGFAVGKEKVKNVKLELSGNLTENGQTVIDNLVANINNAKNNVDIAIVREENLSINISGNPTDSQQSLIDALLDILQGNEQKINLTIHADFTANEILNGSSNQASGNETYNNETINITALVNETINITALVNETINATENVSVNKIDIAMQYQDNSPYDDNNDGIENINGVIDLSVEKTKFNWDVAQENLCTIWNVYSLDDDGTTPVCYGSERCCNFVGLAAKRPNWNEAYYAAYGKDGATLNNVISAQVLYVDYDLSLSNPYSDIYYSDWKNLTAQFYEGFTRFENICLETCALPNYNDTGYELVFEVGNSSLILNSISYQVLNYERENTKPILLKNFSDVSIKKYRSYTINLSEYFYDEDNDNLAFDYYNSSGTNISIINVKIINDTAILQADDNPGTVFMYFIANDAKDLTTSNIFSVEVTENKKGPGILKSLRQVLGIG